MRNLRSSQRSGLAVGVIDGSDLYDIATHDPKTLKPRKNAQKLPRRPAPWFRSSGS